MLYICLKCGILLVYLTYRDYVLFYRTPTLVKKPVKRRRIANVDTVELEILRQLKEIPTPSCFNENDDEDLAYSKTIALTLKRLEPQQKAQAKIKIQQLLYDIEFSPTGSVPSHHQSLYTHTGNTHAHRYNRDPYYNFQM